MTFALVLALLLCGAALLRTATPETARQLMRQHLHQVNTIMLQAMQQPYP